MWVARNKDGTLNFFSKVPDRLGVSWCVGDNVSTYHCKLDSTLFPELTWNNEPIEIELVPKNNIYYKLIYWTTWLVSGDKWVERFFSDFESAKKEAKRMNDLGAQNVGVYKCSKQEKL